MSEWGSEKVVSGLPTTWADSEPVDTATMRLALQQLQHRLESRVQPVTTLTSYPGGPPIYGEDMGAWGGGDDFPLVRYVRLLWSGYVPALDGGRLPRFLCEAQVAASATPAAGEEPMVAFGIEVDGDLVRPRYATSTTTDTEGDGYVGRRFASTTPTLWQPPPIAIDSAPVGEHPWAFVRVWLYAGQQASPSTPPFFTGPYPIVTMAAVRLYGGDV